MATYYVRNSLGNVSEDGSREAPFKSLVSLYTALGGDMTNNTINIYANDTFDEAVNLAGSTAGARFSGSSFVFQDYQPALSDSLRPTITRAKRDFTWTVLSGNVYISNESLNFNASYGTFGGVILEDSVPLNFVLFTTDNATTATAMTAGSSSFNPNTGKYLIYPRTGTPSSHTYAGSAGVISALNIRAAHSYTVRNIILELASGGVTFGGTGADNNLGNYVYDNMIIRNMGGGYSSQTIGAGFYAGDGISTFGDTGQYGESFIKNSIITQIFDAGSAPQTIDNSNIKNLHFDNCDISYCGMYGVSFVTITGTTASVINNCSVRKSRISNIGNGFSGDRGGIGLQAYSQNSGANVKVDNCLFYNNEVSDCSTWGVSIYQPNGNTNISHRNKISNCGTGLYLRTSTGFIAGYRNEHKYNIVENCTIGAEFHNGSTGLAGSAMRLSNNTFNNCTTGISDTAKASDTVVITNNLIVGSATGISSAGVSTLVKSTNNLSNCTSNYSGTTQGTDTLTTVTLDASYVPSTLLTGTAQQPDVDYNGNYANSIVGATNKANQHIIGYFI